VFGNLPGHVRGAQANRVVLRPLQRGEHGSRRFPAVAKHTKVDGTVCPQGPVFYVYLDHFGRFTDQGAVPHGPHVQGTPPADNQVSP
jgi:hypothetical protein